MVLSRSNNKLVRGVILFILERDCDRENGWIVLDFNFGVFWKPYHEEESIICEGNQCWVIPDKSMKIVIGKLTELLSSLERDKGRMGLIATTTKGIGVQHFYTF